MRLPRCVAAVVITVAMTACVGDAPSTPTAPVSIAERLDPRLRDDCGGWVPSADLLDEASKLGDVATKASALAALDAATPAHRIDVLRAGLRLADDASARSCAARLEWQWIDRWECARCVDLLIDFVLTPGTEADYEKFRSYLGSVELTRFLRALPPLPWAADPGRTIMQTHRIARAVDLPAYIELTRRSDVAVADEAWAEISLLGYWNDEFSEEVTRREVEISGGIVSAPSAVGGPGLPPVLSAWLRASTIDRDILDAKDADRLQYEKIRWCWACTPGPTDSELLMKLADFGDTQWSCVAGVAYTLLGKLDDPTTDAFLRRKAADGESAAFWALARRGDAEALEHVVADARVGDTFDDFALALLMEVDPTRARRLLDELLLGPDDHVARKILRFLADFAAPGAEFEPCGFDWRRTSFDGFARAVMEAKIAARASRSRRPRLPHARARARRGARDDVDRRTRRGRGRVPRDERTRRVRRGAASMPSRQRR